MGVIDINFLNLKTKHRISGKEVAGSRKTLRYQFHAYQKSLEEINCGDKINIAEI